MPPIGRRIVRCEQHLQINLDDDASAHIVFLASDWQVLRVEGLVYETAPDARSFVLSAGAGRGGVLDIGPTYKGEFFGPVHSAVTIEMLPSDGAVLEIVRRKQVF